MRHAMHARCPMPFRHRSLSLFAGFAVGLSAALAAPLPLRAAETVVLEFGPFSRSISTETLVSFAETGEVAPQLAPFLRRLDAPQQAGLRTILSRSRSVNLVPISQWFNSPMGDRSLEFFGQLVKTEAGLNGRQALRAAIVAAAAEDGNISLIDIIRHFPTASLRLDLAQALDISRQVRAEARDTLAIVAAIEQQSRGRSQSALPPL
jgi:hypothetical protein